MDNESFGQVLDVVRLFVREQVVPRPYRLYEGTSEIQKLIIARLLSAVSS